VVSIAKAPSGDTFVVVLMSQGLESPETIFTKSILIASIGEEKYSSITLGRSFASG